MKVVFRVDASIEIGTGHVMRCLTLADKLGSAGDDIFFICRDFPGNMVDFVKAKGYPVDVLPRPLSWIDNVPVSDMPVHASWLGVPWNEDAGATASAIAKHGTAIDWLVVDHYAIEASWETSLRQCTSKIMVIDDLADRQHDCDLLLDQNLYHDLHLRYEGKVGKDCRLLLGPDFVLLRQEFREGRKGLRTRDGRVRRILVFFGGADPGNITDLTLDAINDLERQDLCVDVIIGPSNPNLEALISKCGRMQNVACEIKVDNMSDFMIDADLGIGGAGTSTWERCAMFLPALVVSLAANQRPIAEAVESAGAITYLGESGNINAHDMMHAIRDACDQPGLLKRQGQLAGSLVDTLGVERVTAEMAKLG